MISVARRSNNQEHDAEVSARFDATAARFKPEVSAGDFRLDAVLRAVGPVEGLRVLDLGCGKGRFALHMADHGAEVVGIDLSLSMLLQATEIDRARASARRLPFADSTFDAVIAIEVLEHVGEVRPILLEARRVLRPGGRLAIIDKNALAIDSNRPWLPSLAIKWIDQKRGRWMYPSGGPVQERWFLPRSLQKTLVQVGFERSKVESLLTPSENRRWLFRAIPGVRLMTLWSASAPDHLKPGPAEGLV